MSYLRSCAVSVLLMTAGILSAANAPDFASRAVSAPLTGVQPAFSTGQPEALVVVGQTYVYHVVLSGNPPPTLAVTNGPAGMVWTQDPSPTSGPYQGDYSSGSLTWTPTAAGSHNVVITASNSQGSKTQSWTVRAISPPPAHQVDGKSALKVMCMGDSITCGWSLSVGGYRKPLGDLLRSAGYSITFVGGMENIRGSSGNDNIDGNNIANILMGDPTDAFGGADWLRGNGGNDTLLGVGGNDTLWGGDGDDRIFGDNDPFSQDQGNFASGDDSLRGDIGNDTLFGGFGTNTLDGGTGNDQADYSGFFDDFGNSTYAIVANMDAGLVTVIQTDQFGDTYLVATDTLISIEYIVGTSGNDAIWARTDIALPVDTFGTIWGGAGNDDLHGGRFLDVIYGGDGNDTQSDGGISIPMR